MNKTKIEYADYTWNPIAMRCTPVSEGCANCWHLRMAKRLAANPKIDVFRRKAYAGAVPHMLCHYPEDWFPLVLDDLMGHAPSVIAAQFMGDLWHESIDFETISFLYELMNAARKHTFLLLTKRANRMAEWMAFETDETGEGFLDEGNLWHGVTAENQQRADERIPILLQTPAAHRWVSLEPMLSAVDLRFGPRKTCHWCGGKGCWTPSDGGPPITCECMQNNLSLHGVVCGCESGPRRRLMQLEWAVDLVRQCAKAGVPCFVKQIEVNGKVSHDPADWPPELRVRQLPWAAQDA
jgi:protein gp37